MQYLLLITVIIVSAIIYKFGGMGIYGDTNTYYSYLAVIYHHFDFNYIPQKDMRLSSLGYFYPKYPYGVSLCILPLFIIANIYTLLLGEQPTGYNKYFLIIYGFAPLLYLIVFSKINYNILEKLFDKKIAIISLIAIIYGTGIFYYLTHEGFYPHIYSYSFITLFIWLLVNKDKFKNLSLYNFFLGLTLGFITVIRNLNILVILLYIFYDADSFKALIEKFKNFILKPKEQLLPFISGSLIFILPLCIFWYIKTGYFILSTYKHLVDYEKINIPYDGEHDYFL